jgi:hypothetical protein
MKVFLAGEGKDELGDWFHHPSYRTGNDAPGLIEALLHKLGVDVQVANGRRWKDIAKYAAGSKRSRENKNVLGAAQEALDLKCEALIFVRDLDGEPSRRAEIKQGLVEAAEKFPGLTVCGGVAAQQIEAWILALLGHHGSASHSDSKVALRAHGLETRAQKIDAVANADLARVPPDAESLKEWLDSAAALKE